MDDILSHGEFAKKKRVNSRTKGNTFERKVAGLFNKRFETKEFTRSPGSGAFATTHTNLPQHLKVFGDLITPLNFGFSIECKNGYKLEFDAPFKKCSELWKFIEQAKRDAVKGEKEWMVVYQKTRRETLVIVGKAYPIQRRMEIHGETFVYTLEDFLRLDDFHFFLEAQP